MENDFDDVGLPSHVDDYFETNPNDLSYAYENTNREMILGEVNMLDFQSEQKDLIPRSLHPDEFENLQKEY